MFGKRDKTAVTIWVIISILFIITVYFMLPYILPVLGFRSFIVISGSMQHYPEHQAFFEAFWEQKGISSENLPLRYGFSKNDLVLITDSGNYSLGDVVEIRKPKSKSVFIHRIFELNTTHFRDIGDNIIKESSMRTVLLGVTGTSITPYEKNQTIRPETEFVYEGPYYEIGSHYWMPVSYIEGEVFLVLPQAGFINNLMKGYAQDEN